MFSPDTLAILNRVLNGWRESAEDTSYSRAVVELAIEEGSHELLRKAAGRAEGKYPVWAPSVLRHVADAERDGRTVRQSHQTTHFDWEIAPPGVPREPPSAPPAVSLLPNPDGSGTVQVWIDGRIVAASARLDPKLDAGPRGPDPRFAPEVAQAARVAASNARTRAGELFATPAVRGGGHAEQRERDMARTLDRAADMIDRLAIDRALYRLQLDTPKITDLLRAAVTLRTLARSHDARPGDVPDFRSLAADIFLASADSIEQYANSLAPEATSEPVEAPEPEPPTTFALFGEEPGQHGAWLERVPAGAIVYRQVSHPRGEKHGKPYTWDEWVDAPKLIRFLQSARPGVVLPDVLSEGAAT